MDYTAYLLGRLLAALGGGPGEYAAVLGDRAAFAPLLAQATAGGQQDRLDRIMALLPAEAFSDGWTADAQSAFALGYYHQRAALRAGEQPGPGALPAEPPLDGGTLTIRLEPDLLAWVKGHGGARLVRDLLRTARQTAL